MTSKTSIHGDSAASERAHASLRAWTGMPAPERIAHGLSALFAGCPAIAYLPPTPGAKRAALATSAHFEDKLLHTPFIRSKLIFDPMFTSIDDNPIWGITEHPVMAEQLTRDARRWQMFREALLDPLNVTDNLSARILDSNGTWIGWCGVFNTRSRWFGADDHQLYSGMLDAMREMIHACHILAPTSGDLHPALRIAQAWPEPAFIVTSSGYILFVNRRGQQEFADTPAWLDDALSEYEALPGKWQRLHVMAPRGAIYVYFRARTALGERFVDAAATACLSLPSYLAQILGGVLQGRTVPQIVEITGKSSTTIATYVARIRDSIKARNRAHLTYSVLESLFQEPDIWPIIVPLHGSPTHAKARVTGA